MHRLLKAGILLLALFTLFAAFSRGKAQAAFERGKSITVVSRESGSGTRGAFIELLGIEARTPDGARKDMTTKEAIIANKTDVMISNVANAPYAIGYISLGSLNSSVKALIVDGVAATTGNVKNGSYKISRPFMLATGSNLSALAGDFIGFILSAEGQKVVSNGYIPVNSAAAAYKGSRPSGKITVAGSSSVTPIMEKLKEAYIALNPAAAIEIQMSDSTSGMLAAINGSCDIGMASRDLKSSELERLKAIPIALDGIAVIVNRENPVSGMTSRQIKDVFTGALEYWSQIGE
ncbi:MAG: substrate-binding domain-containing protein [Acidaminococcales bacterium]|jgi:phosphate transport system substrate-binding protein|nr:substrate-binding domain-containing protein [Acidaminococcales bacterium]